VLLSHLPIPAKVHILTTVGRVSGRWRSKPSFFIIGAQKSGTTSLSHYLSASPGIRPARNKELHYYSRWYHQRSHHWHRAHFPLSLLRTGFITGEATPNYLFHPDAPARVATDFPDARLIVSLREPAARAFSHYRMMRRHGHELLSFAEALQAEAARLHDPDWGDAQVYRYSYQSRGLYALQLRRWLEYFDRDQMFIFQAERLFDQPDRVCAEITNWLGVEPVHLDGFEPHHVGDSKTQSDTDRAALAGLRKAYQSPNEDLFELIGMRFAW
jgi:lipopolysaccharide transport system ATP-binding protein